jgi:tetratricopeptide (TPR) repeat protein
MQGVRISAAAAIAGTALVFGVASAAIAQVSEVQQQIANQRMHDPVQWAAIEQHLPNRLTSAPEELEREGDILRARRFPEDANDYYNFALQNGGDAEVLLDKIGLTALEMKDVPWAEAYFRRVVRIDRRNADGWNNLGTVELLNGRIAFAIADYERAVKLEKSRVVFHCNLATAYFEKGDTRGARTEMAAALKLDPLAFEGDGDGWGAATHVLSAEGRGRFSVEMAKLYARGSAVEQMLSALALASEAGLDLRREMRRDAALSRYARDPRISVMVHNTEALRATGKATGRAASL